MFGGMPREVEGQGSSRQGEPNDKISFGESALQAQTSASARLAEAARLRLEQVTPLSKKFSGYLAEYFRELFLFFSFPPSRICAQRSSAASVVRVDCCGSSVSQGAIYLS
jgi:hypothetical protein